MSTRYRHAEIPLSRCLYKTQMPSAIRYMFSGIEWLDDARWAQAEGGGSYLSLGEAEPVPRNRTAKIDGAASSKRIQTGTSRERRIPALLRPISHHLAIQFLKTYVLWDLTPMHCQFIDVEGYQRVFQESKYFVCSYYHFTDSLLD